jgi:SseB protein N-terminal domain
MESTLEQAILEALAHQGDNETATKAYFAFLKARHFLPIEKGSESDPRVLFLQDNDKVLLPIFSCQEYMHVWAGEHLAQIDIYELSAVELLSGLGDDVTLVFNPGMSSYKEFNPEEILKLKTMIAKMKSLLKQ